MEKNIKIKISKKIEFYYAFNKKMEIFKYEYERCIIL